MPRGVVRHFHAPSNAVRGLAAVCPWLAGPGPRRFFERTPLGVPSGVALTTGGLAIGAAVRVVPSVLAWDLGGPLALFAEAFALYGWIAVRRAHQGATTRQGRTE